MKEHIQESGNQRRTLDSRPHASRQASLSTILQAYQTEKKPEPATEEAAQLQTSGSNPVVQLEKYINNKTDRIHLHLEIGQGDHLEIFGKRYNLMGKSDYSLERLQTALNALKAVQGGDKLPGYAECLQWLEDRIAERESSSEESSSSSTPSSSESEPEEPDFTGWTAQDIHKYFQEKKEKKE